MNILPKKRWHVRTKENIARVRRDEAKAAQEQKEREERLKLAESEARTQLLRSRVKNNLKNVDFIPINDNLAPCKNELEHINFFKDAEEGRLQSNEVNKEHEKEKKEEQEKYEKQIGYLTYLGQDTNEALGKKSWYDTLPERSGKIDKTEVNIKGKNLEDPLNVMKKYLTKPVKKIEEKKITNCSLISRNFDEVSSSSSNLNSSSTYSLKSKSPKKHREHKKKRKRRDSSSSDYSSDEQEKEEKRQKLQQLRLERLKREKEERRKAEALFNKLDGKDKKKEEVTSVKQKYNSQYNPYIAKQNYF